MKKLIIVFVLLLLTGCSSENYKNGEVNVLNWSSYIPDDVIRDFEKEYDIKVNYGTYSSNEELLAKISNSKVGTYDLIFPSDYMVELMISKGLLDVIDKNKISNYDNIDELFFHQQYDYKNNYSLPFLMTYVIMAVDRGIIKDNISSYNDLLNVNYKNNIVTIDDQRIVIGSALKALGCSVNGLNESNYDEVKEYLEKLMINIKAFDSDSPKTFLITDEVDIGLMWHAEGIMAKSYNSDIELITPSDGYIISMDNYCLLKESKNRDNAYKFIDYLLRKDVNVRIINSYPYISSLKDVNNIDVKKILSNGSYIENIGYDIKYYDNLWAEIK